MLEEVRWESLFRWLRSVLVGRPDELRNRRQAPRVAHAAQVVGRLDGVDYPCELVDISYEGMRLRCPVELRRGQEMLVSSKPDSGLVGRQRLRCKVAWTRRSTYGTEAGLTYCDSPENVALSWIQLALRRIDPAQGRRQARRIEAGVFVDVKDKAGQPLGQGVCLDLSTGGALLRLSRALVVGDVLRLGFGAGDKEANIVLLSRVVSSHHDPDYGEFLIGVRFFPGETRDHQRLRSLLLTLLDEQRQEA